MGILRPATLLVAAAASCVAPAAAAPCFAQPDGPERVRAASPPLKLKRASPSHGSARVGVGAAIRLTFSEPVDPASVTPETIRIHPIFGDDVAWTATYEKGGRRVVVRPDQLLSYSTDYEVVVEEQVRSARGRPSRRTGRVLFFTQPAPPDFPFVPQQFEELSERMFQPRAAHTGTDLGGGFVLLAGGMTDATTASASVELFRLSTKSFGNLRTLPSGPRAYHVAVYDRGVVHLIGGFDGQGAIGTADRYEAGGSFVAAGALLAESRDFAAAIALDDGRILVTGGLTYLLSGAAYSTTAEIIDPTRNTSRLTAGNPIRRRAGHQLTRLDDGRILVTGGTSQFSSAQPTAEIFDPVTETFTVAATTRWNRQQHSVTVLEDKRLLITDGGVGAPELVDPVTLQHTQAEGASSALRSRAPAVRLADGRVMIAGGIEGQGGFSVMLRTVDVFDPESGTSGRGSLKDGGVRLSVGRGGHTLSAFDSGHALIAGGFDPAGGTNLDTVVLYSPLGD